MPITIDGDGTITGVSVGGLPDGIVDTDMLAANAVSSAKLASGVGGKILQVVSTHTHSAASFSVSSDTTTEITDLSVNITPTTATSNMLIFVMWHGEHSAANYNMTFGLRRDSTDIGGPPSANSRTVNIAMIQQGYWNEDDASTPDSCNYNYLDTSRSSGTSQITYKATLRTNHAGTTYNNRTVTDTNQSDYERLTSSITVMEVAA